MTNFEINKSGGGQSKENTPAFLNQLAGIGVVSHLGFIGYRNKESNRCISVYALTKQGIDFANQQQEEGLRRLIDTLYLHATTIDPNLFIYLHLVDPDKYTPECLRETLKTTCSNNRQFLGFKEVQVNR